MAESLARALRGRLTGEVAVPGDDGWDDARAAWNLALDQHPDAVVFAESDDDVVAVVRLAGERGLRVAVQATGHGASSRGSLEGAILLRTERMSGVRIDVEARRAYLRAGTQWMQVAALADEHGLAGLSGSAADVCVTGFALGGGIGWLSRRYGIACNSIRSAEVVTADGEVRRADLDHEPDLFWALRGGGGSFGVVTALELELYPAPDIYGGVFFWPMERAAEVLQAWREWAPTLPDEVTTWGRLMRFPPVEMVPETVRGRAFVIVEAAILGTEAASVDILRPMRALEPAMDSFASLPWSGLASIHMDPPIPVPYAGDGGLLTAFPAEGVDALVELEGPGVDSPLTSIEVRALGGALATPAPDAGALAALEAPFCWFAFGFAPVPQAVPPARARVEDVHRILGPWDFGRRYMNFTEVPVDADQLYPSETAHRLRELRARYDPDGLLQANHPIVAEGQAAPA
jgi:FAD/FMN-containing dehydrogenase